MKKYEPIFIPYDDNDISIINNAPDYGQSTWMVTQSAWMETDSYEYRDFVEDIREQILGNNIKLKKK